MLPADDITEGIHTVIVDLRASQLTPGTAIELLQLPPGFVVTPAEPARFVNGCLVAKLRVSKAAPGGLTIEKLLAAAKLLAADVGAGAELIVTPPAEQLIVELPTWLASMVTEEQLKKLRAAAHAKGAPLTEDEGLKVLGLD